MAKRIELFQSPQDSKWYWRLVARNGEIVSGGVEPYASKENVKRAALRVRSLIVDAPIVTVEPESVAEVAAVVTETAPT